MKKFGVIFLLIASLHAGADVVVVQTVETDGNVQKDITKVKGAKFRVDVSWHGNGTIDMSDITDTVKGESIMLFHGAKKFTKLSGDMNAQPTREELLKDGHNDPLPDQPPRLWRTPEKKKR